MFPYRNEKRENIEEVPDATLMAGESTPTPVRRTGAHDERSPVQGVTIFSSSEAFKKSDQERATGTNASNSAKIGRCIVAEDTVVSRRDAKGHFDGEETSFRALGLNNWINGNLLRFGLTLPTPVQCSCIPAILQGRDVIATRHG